MKQYAEIWLPTLTIAFVLPNSMFTMERTVIDSVNLTAVLSKSGFHPVHQLMEILLGIVTSPNPRLTDDNHVKKVDPFLRTLLVRKFRE